MNPPSTRFGDHNSRRYFVKQSLQTGLISLAGASLLAACSRGNGEEKEVSPPEDLMQEHGLLNRILLIYDHTRQQIISGQAPNLPALNASAGIIRSFVVSRHEYDSLGEEFENNEQKHFGKDGFEAMVGKVSDIEKQLGIYDLNQFTPA